MFTIIRELHVQAAHEHAHAQHVYSAILPNTFWFLECFSRNSVAYIRCLLILAINSIHIGSIEPMADDKKTGVKVKSLFIALSRYFLKTDFFLF